MAIAPEKFFGLAGRLEVRVINEDANLSNALTLRVENGPLITRLSRAKIRAGRGAVELLFSGVAFQPEIVLFADHQALPTTFINDTAFTAELPGSLTARVGQLTLQARHPDGGRSNKVVVKIIE